MCVAFRRNEELDNKAVIRRLKCRVAELETELVHMRGNNICLNKIR